MPRRDTVRTVLLVPLLLLRLGEGGGLAQPTAEPTVAPSLPDWLSLTGSLRARSERRDRLRLTQPGDEGYLLTRLRLGVELRASPWARVHFQAEDSRAPGLPRSPSVLRNAVDLYQGYLELGRPGGRVRLRVGRQELIYGGHRLLSSNPWRNTGRNFDAARVMVGTPSRGVDLLASAVVDKEDGLDGWVDGESLFGGYGRLGRADRGVRVEPYLLLRHRSRAGRAEGERRVSTGARVGYRPGGAFDFSGEAVRQTGDAGTAAIGGWMAYGIAGYGLDRVPWRPRLEGELSQASGDTDSNDGRRGGFDPLYATPHRFYGLADLVGARNIRDARVSIAVRPVTGLSVAVDLHRLWLATRGDGLYDANLTPLVTAPPEGLATSDVGVELDLTATYALGSRVAIGGGWSRFSSGRLLTDVAPRRVRFVHVWIETNLGTPQR